MRKEDVISSGVMMIVSILVLIGFTVAWYTVDKGATVMGMHMVAGERETIIIALTPGGEDVAVLAENETEGDEYADIGMEALTNIENGKLAPGAFGKVTFYVRPTEEGIEYCDIMPSISIAQNQTWYTREDYAKESITAVEGAITLPKLYEITQRHIVFFSDEEMTQRIDTPADLRIIWTEEESNALAEKSIPIYWQWYYEYPFSAEQEKDLTEEQKEQYIYEYDVEDTKLGNNITSMKFHFTFTAN